MNEFERAIAAQRDEARHQDEVARRRANDARANEASTRARIAGFIDLMNRLAVAPKPFFTRQENATYKRARFAEYIPTVDTCRCDYVYDVGGYFWSLQGESKALAPGLLGATQDGRIVQLQVAPPVLSHKRKAVSGLKELHVVRISPSARSYLRPGVSVAWYLGEVALESDAPVSAEYFASAARVLLESPPNVG